MYDCIRSYKRQEWELLRNKDCNDSFTADGCSNFFPRTCHAKHIKRVRREPGLFNEEFRCTERLCLCSKTYCCWDSLSNVFIFSSNGLNERTIGYNADGALANLRKVLDERDKNLYQSWNPLKGPLCRNLRAVKENTPFFYPNQIVEADGNHTLPLEAWILFIRFGYENSYSLIYFF